MTQEFGKKLYEDGAFADFARITGLLVDSVSLERRSPPYPDILCTVGGEPRGYELTRLTEPAIERNVLLGRSGTVNFAIDVQDVVSIILKKTESNMYEACKSSW